MPVIQAGTPTFVLFLLLSIYTVVMSVKDTILKLHTGRNNKFLGAHVTEKN
jgi:hypothetical protein